MKTCLSSIWLFAAASGAAHADVCSQNKGQMLQLIDCGDAVKCQQAQDDDALKHTLPVTPFCQIGRGVIKAQTLSDAAGPSEPLAVRIFLAHDRFEPNGHTNQPADYFCLLPEVGGHLHSYLIPEDSGEVNACEFSDGSSLSDWSLYYGSGPDAPPSFQALSILLRSLRS